MAFPKKFGPSEVPTSVARLLADLFPQLLTGRHPALAALREQFRGARISQVEMTGAGFYAEFAVPADAPMADPPNFTGGRADITLSGAQHGAGCIVFVREGRLAVFEGFTYDDHWGLDATVLDITGVVPLSPDAGR